MSVEKGFTKENNDYRTFSLGNVDPYCVHFSYTSLSNQFQIGGHRFLTADSNCLVTRTSWVSSGSTCLNRTLQWKDG